MPNEDRTRGGAEQDPATSAAPATVAARLRQRRDEIERAFEREARRSLPGARAQDSATLLDDLPQLIDALVPHLERPGAAPAQTSLERRLSRSHGAKRAQIAGYSVEQILAEHRLLRRTVFEVLERDAPPVPPRERNILLDVIQLGAKHAASQFLHVRVAHARHWAWLPVNRIAKYGTGLVLVALATLLQWLLGPLIRNPPYILYYPAVIAAAFVADGLFVTVLAAVVAQYLFVPPRFSFAVAWPGDVLSAGLFLINGLVISLVTNGLRPARIKAMAAAREQVTARQEMEEALANLEREEQLREQFVATLSHDLRGPLSAIMTSVQILMRQPEKVEARERLQQRILQGARRAERMINDLLDVSRIREGEGLPLVVEACDLAAVVEDAVDELRLIHGDRFVLKGKSPLPGYWSSGDVRRVVHNLASNAIKYGAASSPVEIEVEATDGTVEIRVHNALKDPGAALTREEIRDLFEPYRRTAWATASGKQGWGLG